MVFDENDFNVFSKIGFMFFFSGSFRDEFGCKGEDLL